MSRSTAGDSPEQPLFFAKPEQFRAWLEKHPENTAELWVGFHKRDTGKPSLTWPQSVDEALCFGWIDGRRKSLGDTSYTIRFTPRLATSKWSTVNSRRIAELIAAGRVLPAGLAAFERRDPVKSGVYAYEQRLSAKLEPEAERRFRADQRAWAYFEAEAPWYRRLATYWVVSAKREETRERRLATLIDCSARGSRIGELYLPAKSDSSKSKSRPKSKSKPKSKPKSKSKSKSK
jgi:uncharacterized protein YdeI (YjbR/CyaY-like superfamily)